MIQGGPPAVAESRNIRLLIEYEGTRYAGWQAQRGPRTVAGEILKAIESALRESPGLLASGRTDQGVHAEGQVASFLTRSPLPPSSIAEALNGVLPADINVLDAAEAPLSFHPRHDALARRYRYQIAVRRSAFFKHFIWWVRQPFRLDLMERAAADLLGRHDFTSFADRTADVREPRVRVREASFRRGGLITSFTIEADHFLPRMVRRIIGVLVAIGRGDLPPASVRNFLNEHVDTPAQWTAPASGLFLERVIYPGETTGGRGKRRSPPGVRNRAGRRPSRRERHPAR